MKKLPKSIASIVTLALAGAMLIAPVQAAENEVSIPLVLPENDGCLEGLPDDVLEMYTGFARKVEKSVWENFEGREGPYNVYLLSMAWENEFEINADAQINSLCEKYRELGYVDEYVSLQANNDISTQIQQMQTAIEKGADIILVQPCTTSGLNTVIEQAYDAGILVVTFATSTDSPYAINTGVNQTLMAAQVALGMAEAMNYEGNLLLCEGVAGNSSNEEGKTGAMMIFDQCPDIKIVGDVYGEWNPAVYKTQVTQFMASYAGELDAVMQMGQGFAGCTSALEEAGYDDILVSGYDGKQGEIAYAMEHKDDDWFHMVGIANLGDTQALNAFMIGLYTMMGYGPKVNTFILETPYIDDSTVEMWYDDSYEIGSEAYCQLPEGIDVMNEEALNVLFREPPVDPAQ